MPVKFQGKFQVKTISVRTLVRFCYSSSSELQQSLERSHGNTSESSPDSPHQPRLTVTPLGAAWSTQRFQNSASHFHIIFSGSSFLTGVQARLLCICFQSEKKQALKFWKSLACISEKLHISKAENTPCSLKQADVIFIYRNLLIGILREITGDVSGREVSRGMF